MKLFVGIPIPEDVALFLNSSSRTCHDGKDDLEENPIDMHITLRYIGEADIDVVSSCLEGIKYPKFRIETSHMGRFLNGEENVLWAGYSDVAQNLPRLKDMVDASLFSLIGKDRYDVFRPHTSLVFSHDPASIWEKPLSPLGLDVDRFILYRIDESQKNNRFIPLRTFYLKDAVPLVCINDFHGAIENAQRLCSSVKIFRRQNPDAAVFFGGDNYFGNPRVERLGFRPVLELMKALGVEYSAIGNHDWEYGIEKLRQSQDEGGFRYLAANLSDRDCFLPYVVIERKGRKICVAGFVTSDQIPSPEMDDSVKQITILPPSSCMSEIKERMDAEELSALVALTHLPLRVDGSADDEWELRDLAFSESRPAGIFAAHFHRFKALVMNGVAVSEGGCRGLGYAGLYVMFDGNDVDGAIPFFVKAEEEGEDKEAQEIEFRMTQDTEEYDEVLFTLHDSTLEGNGNTIPYSGTPLGRVVVNRIRELFRPDAVLFYQGRMGASFPKMAVTLEDFHRTFFFRNRLYLVSMTGCEIIRNIEIGMRTREAEGKAPLAVSGLKVTVDPKKSYMHRVCSVVKKNEEKLDENKLYSVVIDDFILSESAGFVVGNKEKAEYLGCGIRDIMLKEFSDGFTFDRTEWIEIVEEE